MRFRKEKEKGPKNILAAYEITLKNLIYYNYKITAFILVHFQKKVTYSRDCKVEFSVQSLVSILK